MIWFRRVLQNFYLNSQIIEGFVFFLQEACDQLEVDLQYAERENFYFGAKLVRGAYMEQERSRASTLGYADPINPSFEATSAMYMKSLDHVFQQIQRQPKGKISVMVASHNEDTVRDTLNK